MNLCCKQSGIELKSSRFQDIIKEVDITNLIDTCRIDIIGESILDDWSKAEIIRQRETRKLYGIQPIQLGKNNIDKYIIGYTTVLVLDTQKTNMTGILDKQSLSSLAQQQDELDTFQFVQHYMHELSKQYNFKNKPVCVGLIDRMYIGKPFRNNKLGSWMIDNIKELVEFYSKQTIDALVLEPGDFANEQESYFKMQREQYVDKYLRDFYRKHGFKNYRQNSLLGKIGKNDGQVFQNKYMVKL